MEITNNSVAIIGAGISGIATAKIFKQNNIPFDWFEKGSYAGGLWNCKNDNGFTRAYDSLCLNLSKNSFGFSDYPMPKDYSYFPNHVQVMKYIQSYLDKFSLSNLIKFNHHVTNIDWDPEKEEWVLTINDKIYRYKHIVVSIGNFNMPQYPSWAKDCKVPYMHSQQYKNPEIFKDKRILLVGIGSSSHDISLDAVPVAKEVAILVRRGASLYPKILWNLIPIDSMQILNRILYKVGLKPLPHRVVAPTVRKIVVAYYGDQEKIYKIPYVKIPTLVTDQFMEYLKTNKIKILPDIEKISDQEFTFKNGVTYKPDMVVFCTGYTHKEPFLEKSKYITNDDLQFRNMFLDLTPLNHKNIYFIGYANAVGSQSLLSEKQAIYVANLIKGKFKEPDLEKKKQIVKEQWEELEHDYVMNKITEHAVFIYNYMYLLDQIQKENY